MATSRLPLTLSRTTNLRNPSGELPLSSRLIGTFHLLNIRTRIKSFGINNTTFHLYFISSSDGSSIKADEAPTSLKSTIKNNTEKVNQLYIV